MNYFIVIFKILRSLFFLAVLLLILFIPVCIVSVTMFSDDQGRPFGISMDGINDAVDAFINFGDKIFGP